MLPVASVTFQGVGLELLEHLGEVQQQELDLDVFSNSLIELTIKSFIIPSCISCMFGALNHVLVDMLVVLHLSAQSACSEDWARLGCPK